MRLRKFLPFVLLIAVLLVAACAPVTPVIPQTGPEGQGQSGTVMPGDSGQGDTGSQNQGGQTGQGGTGTGTGSDNNQGGSGSNDGTGTGNNQGGTGTGQGGSTGGSGGIIGGSGSQGGSTGGNTAPSPSGSQNELDDNLRNSIAQFVSQEAGGSADNVEVVWAQQVDFQNGCLDVASQGEMCSQAITPGWQVVARSNGNLYVIHTNSNGNNVRLNQNADANSIMGSGSGTGTGNNQGGTGGNTGGNQSGTGGTSGNQGSSTGNQGGSSSGNGGGLRVGLDQVINIASQFLGQTLNVPINQVALTSVSVETWSDSCLGVGQANESCALVTTPGYRISFNVGGQNYELRTDSTGSNMRLVQGAQQ